ISIDAKGRIFLEETELPISALAARLKAIAANRDPSRTVVYVRGDRRLAYGRVVQVMATVTSAGFAKVALVAERPGKGAAAKDGR
ncbi:MAG: protein TolR, partial [Alphaproteobacteria bacterium]